METKTSNTHKRYIARTFAGLEDLLAEEIKAIGGKSVKVSRRAVEFEADTYVFYKVNVWSRLALDVLQPVYAFRATSPDQLYTQLMRLRWEKYLTPDDTFMITSVIHSHRFTHSHYAQLKAKDAIVDYFRNQTGKRPNVDKYRPSVKITLRIIGERCEVLLNSSGDPLFKRGYRRATGGAPLNEVLAAGILKLSNWTPDTPLLDPMCGSGTFLIEAAMMAYNVAPGLIRKNYGFQQWKSYDAALFRSVIKEAEEAVRSRRVSIMGYDINASTVRIAQANIANVRALCTGIEVQHKDFFASEKHTSTGCIVMNPPYDKRIALDDAHAFYNQIGSRLKHHYTAYDAWIFTANLPASKKIGLKTSSRKILFNGPDECRLLHYQLYKGSKK